MPVEHGGHQTGLFVLYFSTHFLITNCSVADLGSEFFPSRIRIKEFKYFDPKNCFLALGNKSGLFIPDPDPVFLPIPDPGIKKAPCPGSTTLTLN
jgi:hypothetical protein